jgi:hypothetical protein
MKLTTENTEDTERDFKSLLPAFSSELSVSSVVNTLFQLR